MLFESFDSGYLKRIDYGLVRELSGTARRLYRYLDKHFHPPHKTCIAIDLSRLAYQHIGVSPGIELDKARKRHIGPAADELEAVGFLRPAPQGRFEKVRRGVWTATFELAEQVKEKSSTPKGKNANVVATLCKRGVSSATALMLVSQHDSEQIKQAIRAMDEQMQSGAVIRAADRWLQAALRDGYRASTVVERSALRPERKIYRAKNK